MATTIRAAQLPAVVSDLANVTITTPQYTVEIFTILSDNRTLVFGRTNMIVVSSDYGVTQTIGKNFNDGTWSVSGVMQLASGELMVALKHNTNPGEVWRSTGFNPATGQATSWAKVLTLGGPGLYCRSYWGFNSACIAPSWSQHAGAIWITEYGNQTDVAPTPDQGAIRTYLSQDDGRTWRSILDLRTLRPASDVHLHMHGVTYDPWDGRLLISHGDGGNATGTGSGGIFYSDNPTDTAPTFTLIPQTDEHLGIGQVTTIAAFESGIISAPDGTPYAMRLIPRRGFRRYGPVRETAYVSGALPYVYIGARIRRNGHLENPSPGAPILMCSIEPSGAGGGYPQLLVSADGVSMKELYRHNVQAAGGAPGFQFVAGPTADGKIVASLNVDGNARVFTADYVPVSPAAAASGSGGTATAVNVQTFTANGTWTKPAGVTTVRVQALGGGGGGGSGRVSASGTVASGGAGGSGAGYTDIQLPASALGATEAVTVGAGGTGGAAVLVDSTNGNAGGAGTASTVGSKVRAGNGNAGNGGSTGAAISNNGGGGTASGQLGAGSSGTGAAGSNAPTGTPFVAAGGGSGGGVATTPAATGGGNGGASTIPNLTGGAGAAAGAAGGAGVAATAGLPFAGSGGGGGGSAITGAAGAGGAGGSYGSGGGGGGAALNGQGGSGAGGNGAPGIVIVTSW